MKQNLKQVPMPDKKIGIKTINNIQYVYYTTRAYRRKKDGKPTSDEVCIGKKDPITGALIPNKNYIDMFGFMDDVIPGFICKIWGVGYVLKKRAEALGVTEILKKAFPEKWQDILLAAEYIVTKGNVMAYIDDYCESYVTDCLLNSQTTSELFAAISEQQINMFFQEWIDLVQENEFLAYDVTSISSYSEHMPEVEYGYNRDGEDLAQLNVGMFFGERSKRPAFYMLYSGSIPDKTHLEFMMNQSKRLGVKNLTFVMDRGFATKDNVDFMLANGKSFVLCLPAGLKEFPQIVESASTEIKSSVNWIHEHQLFGKMVRQNIYEKDLNIHVFYSLELEQSKRNEMHDRLGRLERELSELSNKKASYRKYEKYFNVVTTGEQEIKFEEDAMKVDKLLETAGYFALVTDRNDLSPDQIISYYRQRDGIEKIFHHAENDLDFKRLKTHDTRTTNGKFFVGFISLILYSDLLYMIKKGPKELSQMTVKKVLLQLEKISIASSDKATTSRLMSPLTKKQKDILQALEITPDTLIEDSKKA